MIRAQTELEGIRSQNAQALEKMRIDAGKFERGSRDADRIASVYATFTSKAQSVEKGILDTINKEGGAYQTALRDSKLDPSKNPNTANMVATAKETLRLMDDGFKKMRDDVAFTQGYLENKLGLPRPPKPAMSADDESAYKWAKSNPSDPRSKDILSRLGK
jgi:hypothetical protein